MSLQSSLLQTKQTQLSQSVLDLSRQLIFLQLYCRQLQTSHRHKDQEFHNCVPMSTFACLWKGRITSSLLMSQAPYWPTGRARSSIIAPGAPMQPSAGDGPCKISGRTGVMLLTTWQKAWTRKQYSPSLTQTEVSLQGRSDRAWILTRGHGTAKAAVTWLPSLCVREIGPCSCM